MIGAPIRSAAIAASLALAGCSLLERVGTDPPVEAHDHADEGEAHGHDHPAPAAAHDHGEDPHAGSGHDHPPPAEADDHAHEGHGDDHEGHEHGQVERVELEASVAASLGLVTVELRPRSWSPSLRIPGTVRVDPDRQAEVSTPSAVRVASLEAPPHATVRAGQLLAVVELVDPEVRQLQVRAVEARAELLEATTERNRTRNYLESLGEGSERSAVSAELDVLAARVQSASSSLGAVLAALELAGLSKSQLRGLEEKGTVVTRVEVRAPKLAGSPDLEVAARPVHQGQTVPAGEALFELVALDELLIIGEAFEADLPGVRRAAREELPVTVEFAAEHGGAHDLRVLSVEGSLDDPRERITHFFVRLPNEIVHTKLDGGHRYVDWVHRAGARVELSVATAEAEERMVLPTSALVPEAGLTWVYRRAGEVWERVAVHPDVNGAEAVLSADSGLHAGDEIVVEGALQLDLVRRQSQSTGSDNGHGHRH